MRAFWRLLIALCALTLGGAAHPCGCGNGKIIKGLDLP